jgi:hypothetical protein
MRRRIDDDKQRRMCSLVFGLGRWLAKTLLGHEKSLPVGGGGVATKGMYSIPASLPSGMLSSSPAPPAFGPAIL